MRKNSSEESPTLSRKLFVPKCFEHGFRQVGCRVDDDGDVPARCVVRHLLLALHVVGLLAADRAEARGERE